MTQLAWLTARLSTSKRVLREVPDDTMTMDEPKYQWSHNDQCDGFETYNVHAYNSSEHKTTSYFSWEMALWDLHISFANWQDVSHTERCLKDTMDTHSWRDSGL